MALPPAIRHQYLRQLFVYNIIWFHGIFFCILQAPILTIIHCLLHYVDMTTATQTINGDLLRTVAKLVESPHWKESLRILKLAVTRSSTLVAPPSTGAMSYHWETTSASNFAEADMYFKKGIIFVYYISSLQLTVGQIIKKRQNKSISRKHFWPNSIFCNFKIGQKSILNQEKV